ncbi:DUF1826 domain-containing protein [Sphingomonas sanguinis]|uniref:DUF1826 domain-containing protein n=1 Tax=Sphingomonas sp. LC-1 TaxID=3110957 RepID=UPI0021BAB493|nr:DUF1826 domain-containing protein [Sphingomonas sp. LC-1]MCT8002829.1 DUF1826 domain-containing protein [Sphingomonas sp. LC-1]
MTAIGMARRVAIGGDSALLDHIARPDTALAIWWRRLPPPLRAALDALDLNGVDSLSVETDLGGSVEASLHAAGYARAVCEMLGADIDRLVRRLAALSGEDRLRVRLAVGHGGDGYQFHADRPPLALRCTYIGPGIQWCCVDGLDAICEVPTGAVGVFKGRMLLDPPMILHRAPPGGDRRLVLAIEPAHGGEWERSLPILPSADPC